jgi:hypothetical protein
MRYIRVPLGQHLGCDLPLLNLSGFRYLVMTNRDRAQASFPILSRSEVHGFEWRHVTPR